MAFRNHPPFHSFLQTTAGNADLAQAAPAVNFLLDERLPIKRESGFAERLSDAQDAHGADDIDLGVWFTAFGNQFREDVAVPVARRCRTFATSNAANRLPVAPEQHVLRMESIQSLFALAPGAGFSSAEQLSDALVKLTESRTTGSEVEPNTESLLSQWLGELNRRRDARPAFVTPFDEHELELNRSDWATYLRNVLGLAHLGGTPDEPLSVVLMRYDLTRVANAAADDRRPDCWAVAPTVLEAGGNSGPGTAFFPYPPDRTKAPAYGFTVSLSSEEEGFDFKPEMLHYYVDYQLEDFYRVGEITDVIDDACLRAARERHLDLHKQDFTFRDDLP